jgi:hypothetical protein
MAWAEAGTAVTYLERRPGVGRAIPDYRGGVSFARTYGHPLSGEAPGWFAEANLDGVYVSRFADDFIGYAQTRAGWTPPPARGLETQFFWNGNLVRDVRSQEWANFSESGPGMRFRWTAMPRAMHFLVTALRGKYSMRQTHFPQTYTDIRVGFWYAFTR